MSVATNQVKSNKLRKKSNRFQALLHWVRVFTAIIVWIACVVYMLYEPKPYYYWLILSVMAFIMPQVDTLIIKKTKVYQKIDKYMLIDSLFSAGLAFGLLDLSLFIFLITAIGGLAIGPAIAGGVKTFLKGAVAYIIGAFVGAAINGFNVDFQTPLAVQIVSTSLLMLYCFIVAVGMRANTLYMRKSRDDLFETARAIETFNEIIKNTSSSLSIKKMLHSMLEPISTLYFDYLMLLVHDKEKNELIVRSVAGRHLSEQIIELQRQVTIPLSKEEGRSSHFEIALSAEKYFYIDHIDEIDDFPDVEKQLYKIRTFSGMLLVPLFVKKQLVALLAYFPEQKSKTLNKKQLGILSHHLSQISSIVNNVLVYKKTVTQMKIVEEHRQRYQKLTNTLSRYLSPTVFESLFKSGKTTETTHKTRYLTVLFADIVGFTDLSDTLEHEDMTSMINHYFNEMAHIAVKYGGTVDKYIGDAVQIFFGDPETKGKKEDANLCVKMAIDMQHALDKIQKYWLSHGVSKDLKIRIGINSGLCNVGNFGSEYHMQYTIAGRHANIAALVEENCTPGKIALSQHTYTLLEEEYTFEEKEKIYAKHLNEEITVYTVIGIRI